MSNFSEQLRSIIKTGDISVYNLAKTMECDRTWLQKVLAGERKMSFESFMTMCSVLENEIGGNLLKQLYEAFCESFFGENEYGNICYIKERLLAMRRLEIYIEKVKKHGFDIEQYCEEYQLNENQKMVVSQIYDMLNIEIEKGRMESKLPTLYFNIPSEWRYLKDLILLFLEIKGLKGNVDFKYIVNSTGKKTTELAMVENFLTATEFATYGYNVLKGDVNLEAEEENIVFSYCVIIGDRVAILSTDGELIVECEKSEVCVQVIKRFADLAQQRTAFLAITDPDAYSGILLSGKIDIKDTIELGNNLCVAAFYTKEILSQIVPKEFPNRNFVIETLDMYYEKSRASNLSLCFTIESVRHFLETNQTKQEGQYYNLEFTDEIKVQLLKDIYQYYCQEDKEIHMLQTEKFQFLKDLHIFAWDQRIVCATGFLYYGEQKIDAMAFVHNPAVAKQIWNFYTYLMYSDAYLDKESSLKVLNNLVNAHIAES